MIKYAKVINEETKQCQVGTGTNDTFYASIGMSPLDVEQGYDGAWYLNGYAPQQSPEELVVQELNQKKFEREEAVSRITVEVDDMVFDGDEISQYRMTGAVITAMAIGDDLDETKTKWVLADNTIAEVSMKQLALASKLAKEKQSELWMIPYQN